MQTRRQTLHVLQAVERYKTEKVKQNIVVDIKAAIPAGIWNHCVGTLRASAPEGGRLKLLDILMATRQWVNHSIWKNIKRVINQYRSPLHHECQYGDNPARVRVALAKTLCDNRKALLTAPYHVIHLTCKNTSPAAYQILSVVLDSTPEDLQLVHLLLADDEAGCMNTAPKPLSKHEVAQLFSMPDGVKARLPLHIASAESRSAKVVSRIIEMNPAALLIRDKDGQLPLPLAVENEVAAIGRVMLRAQPLVEGVDGQVMSLYCGAVSNATRALIRSILMIAKRGARQGSDAPAVALGRVPMECIMMIIKYLAKSVIEGGDREQWRCFANTFNRLTAERGVIPKRAPSIVHTACISIA